MTTKIAWHPRGIGTDSSPGCFVCDAKPDNPAGFMSNCSGFVVNKNDGETLVSLFGRGARLDYREHEPNWIQVKVGACGAHVDNLRRLDATARAADGRLTEADIRACQGRVMSRATVSIANAHDDVALEPEDAELIARMIEGTANCWGGGRSKAMSLEVANILRGRLRDGSEPGEVG